MKRPILGPLVLVPLSLFVGIAYLLGVRLPDRHAVADEPFRNVFLPVDVGDPFKLDRPRRKRRHAVKEDTVAALTEAELGRLLFWDPILSGDRDVDCATCHHPDLGYADRIERSPGPKAIGQGPD